MEDYGSIREKKVEERKLNIQKLFKSELGLIVDVPKPGFGSSNDGNTARRFFRNAEKSSHITGLDVTLIKRIHTLLHVLSSGININVGHFEKYAEETRKLYLQLYGWYYIPVTMHKLLVHGGALIKYVVVPIGQLSEEAQEARNKDVRRFRERNTQKPQNYR